VKVFKFTEKHEKLLRRAFVRWEDCEFGAPAIDCKRPYGNSSVVSDIYEILDIKPEPPEGGWKAGDEVEFSDEQNAQAKILHEETETALQILLQQGAYRLGTYVCEDYGDDWKFKSSV